MEQVLLQYGALGAMVLGLGIGYLRLYTENRNLWQRLLDTQETRRIEALQTQKELTETLTTFSQTSQLLVDKIVTVQKRSK